MTHPHLPQIAGRGVIVQDDKLLLVRGDGDGTYWVLLGGRADLGEDIRACVKREVYEETGLHVRVGDFFAAWEFYNPAISWHTFNTLFFCTIETGTLQENWIDHGGTVQERRFFTLEELCGLKTVFPNFLRTGEWLNTVPNTLYRGMERKEEDTITEKDNS